MVKILGTAITVALVSASLSSAALGRVQIPVEVEEQPTATKYVTSMTSGAPADSMRLRVSLCESTSRFGNTAYIVVDELVWPRPLSAIKVVGVDPDTIPLFKGATEEKPWLLASTRISGGFLSRERKKEVSRLGLKLHELGPHWSAPFKFVAWLSPYKFVVETTYGRFTIEWRSTGEYDLVEIVVLKGASLQKYRPQK